MNAQPHSTSALRSAYEAYAAGKMARRDFIARASALGIGTAMTVFLANTGAVAAQDGTAEASPGAAMPQDRPTFGTENQERGAGGPLNILQWQAPTLLSPHVSTGVKDILGAVPVIEPLIHYMPDASMIPNLVTEVPSQENGGINEDFTEVTLKLLPGLLWSDGEPFTADDVVFTIDWVKNPDNASVNINVYQPIESAEAVDDLTVKVTFAEPNPFWFDPFAGTSTGFVYPKHVLEAGKEAHDAFLSKPIGTGPYVVESFTPQDTVVYKINENYREPNKPFFDTVTVKGGGDPAAAARAIIQTGEYDFAWNLQVEPDVLTAMESPDNPGAAMDYPGISVERINLNFSDPNTEVNGQRSEVNTPHPFLSDLAVRQALSLGIDRQSIADKFYGLGQPVAVNVVNGDPLTDSPNTSWEFNLEKAAQTLEEAGWKFNGDVREKDGVQLKMVFATTVNSVRQKTQAVVKSNLDSIGFQVELQQFDSAIYFDAAVGTEQNINHFYWDLDMYQSIPNNPRPIGYMEMWYAGPDNVNVAQAANQWNGQNQQRYINPDYDMAYEAAKVEIDPQKLAELFITMNDIVVNDVVVIPLVVVGSPRASSKRLRQENIALAAFSYDYWNIANWNLAE